ncbi:hypothetical protein HNR20_002167 [Micromonospora parathelypteridis]|uniref:Uncharacterized protein n=1 Tax=Micromonospora parathelypteridis TaxID=1839617 RepID=A0A840VL35_9ACTN|nr:hypothetical protein [Micromonospora parathelypteridis]
MIGAPPGISHGSVSGTLQVTSKGCPHQRGQRDVSCLATLGQRGDEPATHNLQLTDDMQGAPKEVDVFHGQGWNDRCLLRVQATFADVRASPVWDCARCRGAGRLGPSDRGGRCCCGVLRHRLRAPQRIPLQAQGRYAAQATALPSVTADPLRPSGRSRGQADGLPSGSSGPMVGRRSRAHRHKRAKGCRTVLGRAARGSCCCFAASGSRAVQVDRQDRQVRAIPRCGASAIERTLSPVPRL